MAFFVAFFAAFFVANFLPIMDSDRLGFLSSHIEMSSNLKCVDLHLAK